jgi:hypothetical protein
MELQETEKIKEKDRRKEMYNRKKERENAKINGMKVKSDKK